MPESIKIGIASMAILLGATLMMSPSLPASDDPGKGLFMKFQCNRCHTISKEGIARQPGDDDEDSGSQKPADLSGTGARHAADWMVRYLNKQEALDGKKHPKNFTGSAADAQAVSDWLATLKK